MLFTDSMIASLFSLRAHLLSVWQEEGLQTEEGGAYPKKERRGLLH
jgi:hypothetical protein